jgi:hypothetical protein
VIEFTPVAAAGLIAEAFANSAAHETAGLIAGAAASTAAQEAAGAELGRLRGWGSE